MRCYKCGKDLPPDSKFCQYCGEDLSHVRYCPFCGIQLQEGMNFCPQCGKDIRKTTSDQPIESNNVIPTQNEVTIPAWSKTAAIVPGTAPIEDSEKQEEPTTSWEEQLDCPTDARNSILKEKVENPEEPIPESSEGIQAEKEMAEEEPLPTTGEQIKEAGESAQKQGKSKKWILAAALCIIAVIVAGVYLWPRNNSESSNPTESKVDISKIADSVLYLEVFDENNDLIGSASGFLVNDQSTLVTNYHVVQDAYHIVAKTADGAQTTDVSCILAYDEIADLAVLSCDSKVMAEPLTLGDSETVKQGDAVYAVGYPLGLANTLSDGIVSSRYIDEYDNDIIQVTAAISEGNSGGPLLDANGQVIGVMCAYYVYGQNLNIAIASNTLAGLHESDYQKTNLKYWKNRPVMPGEDISEEIVEESTDKDENIGIAEPITDNVPDNGKPSEQLTNTNEPQFNKIPQYDYSKAKGYADCTDVPDFGSIWGITASSIEDDSYEDLFKAYAYTYNWTDIGSIQSICDDVYFNLLKQWGFVQTTADHNQYGVIYGYATIDQQIMISYSNYNNRVCISVSDFRHEEPLIKDATDEFVPNETYDTFPNVPDFGMLNSVKPYAVLNYSSVSATYVYLHSDLQAAGTYTMSYNLYDKKLLEYGYSVLNYSYDANGNPVTNYGKYVNGTAYVVLVNPLDNYLGNGCMSISIGQG